MSKERTALFKIYFEIPRFTIIYKNKQDLFIAFHRKLKELNLDIDNITWADGEGDRSLVNSPDDVLAAANFYAYPCVRLFHRISHDCSHHRKAAVCFSIQGNEDEVETKKNYAQTANNNSGSVVNEDRTVFFKIFFEVPRFTITFKSKKDLFTAFQNKLKELNLDVNGISWADWNGDRSLIETPDDLFGAVELYICNGTPVKIFYPTIPPNLKTSVYSSSDEEEKKRKDKTQKRSSSPFCNSGCYHPSPRHTHDNCEPCLLYL